ncbi:hypothetical protein FOQG_08755 [Fusarium oxysporum f. sp. raphani 54005]|jgi:hypothetical protein|uniref:Uncharacterized protein n=5 Tax=Fusarium oxysporum TaxID=5507 RepID=W9IRB1_FUSOX|nr:hypothetical protein FOYG_04384 [Fusarium oxysporum NRRL 32931]EWZ42915.1 hypothetical protein FOZG_07688 [Fusarium oxysporum Fo47]EXA00004.1 hypothetical protein FOWG_00362 [Fusarium oxysporum f. sp. lycopersici MN25]EXA46818.1 hypothetical protein FOVG_04134 [Fusarium oxysporum f. sp. pisi HDV247]EXK87884.1 hypothetical protein FOQG_08755 [Fusarium oxysporum f. sp. raphani 54005]EXL58674.1 hypothetical protein FOCG_02160 [Fusarium oxysporum f. sp. radicis-lycopersici 26381]EXL85655.1 hyp
MSSAVGHAGEAGDIDFPKTKTRKSLYLIWIPMFMDATSPSF